MQKVLERPIKTKSSKITQEVVTITPELAEAFLTTNEGNRKVSAPHVDAWARAMRDGKWRFTGDPIRFDKDGNLIDGQHRLLACVKSGASFEATIMYGFPPETRDVIDNNKPRSHSDILQLHDVRNATHVAVAVGWLIGARSGFGTARAFRKGSRITGADLLDVLDKHPMLVSYVGRTIRLTPPINGVSKGGLAWVWYAAAEILRKPKEAETFATVFSTGVPSRPGCPVHAYRERMMSKRNGPAIIMPEAQAAGLVHAWNLFASDQIVQSFRMPKEVWIQGLDRKKL